MGKLLATIKIEQEVYRKTRKPEDYWKIPLGTRKYCHSKPCRLPGHDVFGKRQSEVK